MLFSLYVIKCRLVLVGAIYVGAHCIFSFTKVTEIVSITLFLITL